MKAVVMREFGPPDVLRLEDVPGPSAGRAAVVIGVEFASITFVETQVRAGKAPSRAMLPELPAILGNGVGGTVILAGEEAPLGGKGGYAEEAAAAAAGLIEVPDGLGLRDATALLADGRTALSLTELAAIGRGDTVLVEAAAGGVGTLLVQFARNTGARVVALAGGERKLAVARDLGADLAVDYRDAGWPSRVREAVGKVDVVFDGVGGEIGLASFGLLGEGGRFCPFGMASGGFTPAGQDLAREHGVTVLRNGPPDPQRLKALSKAALDEAAAGRVRPVIGQEFELARAAAAHEAIETRATVGKTLLVVPGGADEE
jgi:NADPH:quinone reductase